MFTHEHHQLRKVAVFKKKDHQIIDGASHAVYDHAHGFRPLLRHRLVECPCPLGVI
jgi:hypothetical protein